MVKLFLFFISLTIVSCSTPPQNYSRLFKAEKYTVLEPTLGVHWEPTYIHIDNRTLTVIYKDSTWIFRRIKPKYYNENHYKGLLYMDNEYYTFDIHNEMWMILNKAKTTDHSPYVQSTKKYVIYEYLSK